MDAKPRKIKKPQTSVKVVRNMGEEMAGSIFSLSKSNGKRKPTMPAMIMFKIMAAKIISPK